MTTTPIDKAAKFSVPPLVVVGIGAAVIIGGLLARYPMLKLSVDWEIRGTSLNRWQKLFVHITDLLWSHGILFSSVVVCCVFVLLTLQRRASGGRVPGKVNSKSLN
jgi:hypothetical protein